MREPYIGVFGLNSAKMREIAFVGLHTQPKKTREELMHLDQVVKWIREVIRISLTHLKWSKMRLKTDT